MDEAEIRQIIRAKLAAGSLPSQYPTRVTFGGIAELSGTCAACGEDIVLESTQIREDGPDDGPAWLFHPGCFHFFIVELAARRSDEPG
jgi:hypothetical protein